MEACVAGQLHVIAWGPRVAHPGLELASSRALDGDREKMLVLANAEPLKERGALDLALTMRRHAAWQHPTGNVFTCDKRPVSPSADNRKQEVCLRRLRQRRHVGACQGAGLKALVAAQLESFQVLQVCRSCGLIIFQVVFSIYFQMGFTNQKRLENKYLQKNYKHFAKQLQKLHDNFVN